MTDGNADRPTTALFSEGIISDDLQRGEVRRDAAGHYLHACAGCRVLSYMDNHIVDFDRKTVSPSVGLCHRCKAHYYIREGRIEWL